MLTLFLLLSPRTLIQFKSNSNYYFLVGFVKGFFKQVEWSIDVFIEDPFTTD